MEIRLTNVSEVERSRCSDGKYNIQVKTEAGWQDIRVWQEENRRPLAPSESVNQKPGGSHVWTIEMSEERITADICPDIQFGRYRFAYWGLDNQDSLALGCHLI